MALQMALGEETNDLIKNPEGGIFRVDKGRYVVQAVRSKLQTGLGEWLLDTSKGWVSREDLNKTYDIFDIEARAAAIILSVAGVREVTRLSSSFKDRRLSVSFEAKTDYGIIDSTVPWGDV